MMMLPFAEVLERLPVPKLRRARMARARLDAIIYRMIADRRASGRDHGDLLSMLLAAQDDEENSEGTGGSGLGTGSKPLSSQRPAPSAQRLAPSAQPPAPSTQHPAPSAQHPAPSTQYPAPSPLGSGRSGEAAPGLAE